MADVTCARCGEPWDTYHLRHDEVHETSAGQAWIDWELDKEEFEKKLSPGMRKRASSPKRPATEQWTGRLTDFWREQFAELGWKFGTSVVVVLTCPCCKDQEALPDADERTEARTMLGELLEGDEDGLSTTLEDLDR